MFDVAVIGGGIVGLATAFQLTNTIPGLKLVVVEKEARVGQHQSGRNSGVIHAGVYYPPRSLKAEFCRAGNRSMVQFCVENDVPHRVCGKLIVATSDEELKPFEDLFRRAELNGLSPERVSVAELRDEEPNVAAKAAFRIATTGVVDYGAVCARLATMLADRGTAFRLGTKVVAIRPDGSGHRLISPTSEIRANYLVNCAGLYSDRVCEMAGIKPLARILPFRGEYFELVPEKRALVKGLVYPVPNPRLPFLGVHVTKMVDDSVHLGPNAVLAFRREGYGRWDFDAAEFVETVTFPGLWRLWGRYRGDGARELVRSFSRAAFLRSVQRLVPAIQAGDLVPCRAGVRAQAVRADGSLVEDFMIHQSESSLHICNAPSPAATASLEIGKHAANLVGAAFA